MRHAHVMVAGWLLLAVACDRGSPIGSAQPSAAAPICAPATTFADAVPAEIRHVAISGDDASANGSPERPFRTIEAAARNVRPGTAIQVHAGTYSGRTFFVNLRGEKDAPIWITGAPGEPRPIVQDGVEGFHFVRPLFLVVQHLTIANTADNGINVDDGDEVADENAARYVVFRDVDIHDAGRRPSGIAACLKLSGVNDVFVLDSTFARCGANPASGATAVDGVGVHRASVLFNRFSDIGFGAVQFKGGSADVEIRGNRFVNTGWRGVNMGGSTGDPFFRPPLNATAVNFEAARVRVAGNVFVGSETAAAFVGCVDCQFTRNTVVNPSKWALRILQERLSSDRYQFAPAGRGLIADNIFYFRRSDLNAGEDINVGEGTDTNSFALERNVWYAYDDPAASRPRLPAFKGSNRGSIVGTDPAFIDADAGDFRTAAGTSVGGAGAPAGCVTNR